MAACSPYTSATAFGGATSYSAATGDLVIGSGKTVTLAAGTYCFHNVTLTGTGALNVGGAVVVVVNGMLTSSGGASFNTVGKHPGEPADQEQLHGRERREPVAAARPT